MSRKKLNFDQQSKLSASVQLENNIGIISNKNNTIIKSFRLRKTDIEKINDINRRANEANDRGDYSDSDIIRGAIYLLSLQDAVTIKENIQQNK
jgi:hypothetical protein